MSINNNLKAYVKYDKQGYLVPGSLTINRSKPVVGDWEEIPYSECCPPVPRVETFLLLLIFDNIANAPVANPSDVNEWNTFFNTTKFISVLISPTGDIYLKSTSKIVITASLFSNNLNLIKIIDDDGGISGIGDYAFDGCSNLEYVSLPSVKNVNSFAFRNCTGLTYININSTNNLTVFESGFEGANIPNNFNFEKIIRLYSSSFKNSTGITSVNLVKLDANAGLADFCFSGSTITSITVSENSGDSYAISFATGAFQGCTSLQSFETNARVQDILSYMFDGCTSLSTLIFKSPVANKIYEYAFRNCTSLTGIYFPRVREVGNNAFENCTSVTSIYLPNPGAYSGSLGNTTGNNDVFLGITGKNIPAIFNKQALVVNVGSLPDGDIAYLLANNTVTYTDEGCIVFAFDNLTTISSLVPTYTDVASWNTFFDLPANGTAFTSVNVFSPASSYPDDFTLVCLYGGGNDITIKTSLFENVSGLRYVNGAAPYGLGRIIDVEDNAFRNTGLIYAELYYVTTIGNRAFQGCGYWDSLYYISAEAGSLFQSVTSYGDYCFEGLGASVTYPVIRFENNYTALTIGDYCFANSKVSKVGFYIVSAVNNYAFENCTDLTDVALDRAISIGDGAFAGCTKLNNIRINFCEYLGSTTGDNGVFTGITGKSITLFIQQELFTVNGGFPDGDLAYLQSNNTLNVTYTTVYTKGLALEFNTSANALAFFGGTIDTSSVNTKFATVGNSVPFSDIKTFKTGRLVICSNGGNISIPNGLFNGNANIISIVDGPDGSSLSINGSDVNFSIINIGDDVFNGCTNLTTARFQTATNYGARAFKNCTTLSSVNLRHAYTFGDNCFENCTSLTSFDYVRDLISVGNYAFAGCTDVTSYDFPALATIGDYAFYNNTSLTNLNIPYCTALGTTTGDDNVFTGISGNTINLTIPTALDTDADVVALQGANTVTLDRPSFQLTFNTLADADALVGGSTTVANWNTFFDLPTNGTAFTSVVVTENVPIIRPEYINVSYTQEFGCEVKLYGGGNITILTNRFLNYRKLRKVIDNGENVVRINQQAFRQTSLNWYGSSGYTGLTPIEVSFPACTFMEQYAFYSSFGGYFVNFPRLTFISGAWALGGIFSLIPYVYGPGIAAYSDTVIYTTNLPNVISMGSTAILANNACHSINLPQQTFIPTYTFATCSGQINMPSATSTVDQIWWTGNNLPTQVVNMPLVTIFGSSVGDNSQWGSSNPLKGAYRINPFLMTNNAGGPDGDVVRMINGGSNIYLT